MQLSIIIVSWNVCKDVLQCIQSIVDNPPLCSYEIILVDNNSFDDTVAAVRKRFYDVNVIENTDNIGFAAANNIGIQAAKGRYLLFLNPDTLVLPNALDLLFIFMESNPDVGICGPQILNENLTIQRSVRTFPTFKAIFYRFTILKYIGLFKKHFYLWTMYHYDQKKMIDVDQLIGAALMTRVSVIHKLNGFDERFFMYYEEVDLCLRNKEAGYRTVFYPEPKIIHLGGQSADQIPAKAKFYMLSSLVLFLKKHNLKISNRFLIFLFKIGIFSRQFFEMILYFFASLFSVYDKSLFKKNFSRTKSCFIFIMRYYFKLLFA